MWGPGLADAGAIDAPLTDESPIGANPLLPADVLAEAMPGAQSGARENLHHILEERKTPGDRFYALRERERERESWTRTLF